MKRLHLFIVILFIILFGAIYFFFTKNDLSTLDFVGTEDPLSATEEIVSFPSIFLERVPSDSTVSTEDFPAHVDGGYHQSVVAYKERFYVAGMHHVLEYDAQGNLLAMTDRGQIDCASTLAIIGDRLYVACFNEGVYEIDLLSRSIDYKFDKSNGLTELNNLYPVADGETLWVNTFDGLAKIDSQTREVTMYRNELGVTCSSYQAKVSVYHGDVWTQVIADAVCSGGLAHYVKEQDQWEFYGPDFFNTIQRARVDFHDVILTAEGVYVRYQDAGPDHEILSFFDRATETWTRLADTQYKNIDRDITPKLPLREETQTAYFNEQQNVQIWHIPVDGQWKLFPLTLHRYSTSLALGQEEMYFLTSAGLEHFRKEDRFPQVVLENPVAFTHARILTTEDERYVVAVSNDAGEMMCQVNTYAVFVYDRLAQENSFVQAMDVNTLKRPLGQLENCYNLASINLVWKEGKLFIADNQGEVMEIVLARSLIKSVE